MINKNLAITRFHIQEPNSLRVRSTFVALVRGVFLYIQTHLRQFKISIMVCLFEPHMTYHHDSDDLYYIKVLKVTEGQECFKLAVDYYSKLDDRFSRRKMNLYIAFTSIDRWHYGKTGAN